MGGENAGPSFPLQSHNLALYEYFPLNLKCNLQANSELPEISQGAPLSGLCWSPELFCPMNYFALFYPPHLQQAGQCFHDICINKTTDQPYHPLIYIGSPNYTGSPIYVFLLTIT